MVRTLLFMFGMVSLVLVLGCGAARRTEDRLVLSCKSDPATLDPALAKDVPSGQLVNYIFSTLVKFDRQMRIEGDLCDTFDVDPDKRTYTFHLRASARYASGRPVTAQDVKSSFERVLDPATASPRAWVLDRLDGAPEFMADKASHVIGIEVRGPCVVLRLAKPFAPFLGFLTMPAASVVDSEVVKKWGREFPLHDAGSGPFTLLRRVKDSGLDLGPNAYHHFGRPKVKGVVVRVIKEPVTLATEFKLGNIDIAEVPSSEFVSLTKDPRWNGCVEDIPGLNIWYLGLNCEAGPFKDRRLREAAVCAIDKDRIVATVRKGQAVVATGPIPPGLPGHDPSFSGVRYDPERAKRLVRESGLAPGTVLRLIQGEDKANLEVTQMVQAYLQKAGFTVRLQAFEASTFKKKVDQGEFEAFFYSWYADYPDAENFLFPLFHSSRKGGAGNGPRYFDPEVDALLIQAQTTTDDRARSALHHRIEERAVADCSRAFLYHRKMVWIRQPWVNDYQLCPVFNSERLVSVSLDLERLGNI